MGKRNDPAHHHDVTLTSAKELNVIANHNQGSTKGKYW